MIKKRYIFVLVLLIFAITALSTVSAADLNDTDEVIGDEISIDDELGQTEDVILEASGNTFTDLNKKISSSGSTVTLDRDYYYDSSKDGNFKEGIEINKILTINGNGHTIYANGARTFSLDSNANVTIDGVKFVNNRVATFQYGGTISSQGRLTLKNCEFINSSAVMSGGAIISKYILYVYSCNFTNNSANGADQSYGGAIDSWTYLVVNNSRFNNNFAGYGGGAIYASIPNQNFVLNSQFIGNSAGMFAGALSKCTVLGCTFTRNSAELAGAMFCGIAEKCDFWFNNADDGGATYNTTATSCNFIFNSARTHGGAMHSGSASFCSFTLNTATQYGGGIYDGSADCCYFSSNSAKSGNDTYNTNVIKPILRVSDFNSTYNSGDKLIIDFTSPNGVLISNAYVNIDVYKNGNHIGTYTCLSGDGWIVNLDVGNYVAYVSVPTYLVDPVKVKLTINNKENTFTDLNNVISSGGSTVSLDRDYYYTSNDKNFQLGIKINRDLTINGNGHTIYANSARAFEIGENANVTITGINFVNSVNRSAIMTNGGTIFNKGILTLEDCKFTNSTAVRYGAAVYSSNILTVDSCSFIENIAFEYGIEDVSSHGGAIASDGDLYVYNSDFYFNYAGYSGGAIYNDGYMFIFGSEFFFNEAEFGGAIDNDGNMTVYFGDFKYNYANLTAGAIYSAGECYLEDSNFEDNSAKYAGAIYNDDGYMSINCSSFVDNSAIVDGGAIDNSGDMIVYSSSFVNNSAGSGDGGAIDGGVNVYSSSFVDNSAGDEGGALWDCSAVNCSFTGNSASYGGAMYNGSADSCIFKDNSASIEGADTYGTIIINSKVKTKVTLQNNAGTLVAKLTNADTGKAITGAKVVFNINNVNYNVKTNSSGQAKLDIPSLDAGTYPVTATYNGNSKYEPSSASIDITVKADTVLSFEFDNGARELVATLTNGATGQAIKNANVRFVVNGVKSSAKTDANGQAKVSVSSLAMGTYDASASYDGNSKYNPSSNAISFTINKVMTTVTQYYDASTKELVATLINAETGKPIKGATLVFNFNGKKTPVVTDVNGQARFSIGKVNPNGLSAGISYGGNSKYLRSSGSIKIVTDKVPTTISNFYNKETQEVVVTLINFETGKPIKGATVVFNFNGVKTPLKTDANGQVKMSVSKLTSKEYTIGSSYGGNSKYAGSTASLNFFKI